MTLSELLGALFGWLGDLARWCTGWCPRYVVVRCNQRGVRFPRGGGAHELLPGVRWFVPNLDEVHVYSVATDVLQVEPLSLETADGLPVQVGMIVVGRIADVLRYAVENLEADTNMAEVAQGEMQEIVQGCTWEELRGNTAEGTRLGGKLARRMSRALERFGFEVLSCRPTDQVRLRYAARLFGVHSSVNFHPPE